MWNYVRTLRRRKMCKHRWFIQMRLSWGIQIRHGSTQMRRCVTNTRWSWRHRWSLNPTNFHRCERVPHFECVSGRYLHQHGRRLHVRMSRELQTIIGWPTVHMYVEHQLHISCFSNRTTQFQNHCLTILWWTHCCALISLPSPGLPDAWQRIWQVFVQFMAIFGKKMDNGNIIGNIDFSCIFFP